MCVIKCVRSGFHEPIRFLTRSNVQTHTNLTHKCSICPFVLRITCKMIVYNVHHNSDHIVSLQMVLNHSKLLQFFLLWNETRRNRKNVLLWQNTLYNRHRNGREHIRNVWIVHAFEQKSKKTFRVNVILKFRLDFQWFWCCCCCRAVKKMYRNLGEWVCACLFPNETKASKRGNSPSNLFGRLSCSISRVMCDCIIDEHNWIGNSKTEQSTGDATNASNKLYVWNKMKWNK